MSDSPIQPTGDPANDLARRAADLTRWIDGEFEPGHPDPAHFANDPEAGRLRAEAAWLGEALRMSVPATLDVAGPELFMHQLANRMERESPSAAAPARATSPRARWFVPAAAAAVVALAAVLIRPATNPRTLAASADPSILLASYAPDERVRVDARYDAGIDSVVVVLDGLPAVERLDSITAFRSGDSRSVEERLAAGAGFRHRHRGG